MKIHTLTTTALLLLSSTAIAKVSLEQANKLGSELSSIGAQLSANESGTIPAYQGGLKTDANANPYKNIFAAALNLNLGLLPLI